MEIACAHKLRNYEGKCANLHGHNYKIEVTVEGGELNKLNMIMDFGELKSIMEKYISHQFDHKNINEIKPFITENPTAEYMAGFFFAVLRTVLPVNVDICKVRVWETSTSWAEYEE